jgi:hypothetical protein
MTRRDFGIIAQVNLDPLGLGHSTLGLTDGSIPALHKWNTEFTPYCVPNEFISSKIGEYVGLPLPPFGVTQPASEFPSKHIFSSMHFNFKGRDLDPIIPENCVTSLPELCAGILVFDVLVCNSDRHKKNLSGDGMDAPRVLRVFDQGNALFGAVTGREPVGVPRLEALKGRLGITGGAVTGGNRHILLDAFSNNAFFGEWADRFWRLQGDFISRICHEAIQYGLSAAEAIAAESFLNERKTKLRYLLNKHKDEFEGIATWGSL